MRKARIAVMNTSVELTEMLADFFKESGFETVELFTHQFKKGEVMFDEYIKKFQPDVIIYDIAIPYKENYELFKELSSHLIVEKIPFILTTTNKNALETFVGPTRAREIIGKPYDLDLLLSLVQKATNNIA